MAGPERWRLVRPADQLALEIEFGNLAPDASGEAFDPVDPTLPGVVVVHFPSQHLAEETFLAFATEQQPAGPPPVRTVTAGPSRLAFEVPAGTSVPWTVDGLLDWSAFTPRLAGNALPRDQPDGPAPADVAPDVTAIEFPWRLLLSPDPSGSWQHRRQPFVAGERVELWHTSLQNGSTPGGPVRAVFSRRVPDQFRTSTAQRDLDDLVRLSGDFSIAPRNVRHLPYPLWLLRLTTTGMRGWRWTPTPLEADRLQLGMFGANARLRGRWDFPGRVGAPLDQLTSVFGVPAISLESYDHVTGWGRDQFVRIVRRGFVHPGHRATIVKITERRFEPEQVGTKVGPDGQPYGVFGSTTYLRQWFEIVIQQPEIDYGALAGGFTFGGREMPFRRFRFRTLRTPPIDLPLPLSSLEPIARNRAGNDETLFQQEVQRLLEASMQAPFWIQVGGRDFDFAATGTDWAGNPIAITGPLLFVPLEVVASGDTSGVRTRFLDGPSTRRTRPLDRQPVTLADPGTSPPSSTRLPTENVTFGLQAVTAVASAALQPGYSPGWLPTVVGATVGLEAAEQLARGQGSQSVTFDPDYLHGGIGPANPAARFLRLAAPLKAGFGGEQAGGVARPDTTFHAVSAHTGMLADTFQPGPVSPPALAALFGDAKLFGSVRLSDLLAPFTLAADAFSQAGADLDALLAAPGPNLPMPVLRTRRVEGGTEVRYAWKPVLAGTALIQVGTGTELVLDARKLTADDGTSRGGEVVGRLTHFSLQFFGVAEVALEELAFRAAEGRKPDLTVSGFDLRFIGPLTFINSLRDILPADGFSDPPAITIDASGIRAGYSLAIPSLGMGIFSLQNLSLGAQLAVPFDDHPAVVRFNVSERHAPFLVTVMIFGGGGFFALSVSAKGVEAIEAAIEFGGNISLNLGVASGGVYVMAGVYFGRTGDVCTLTGYFRCGGYLSVLGLVSLSIEFYLAFTYRDKGGGRSEIWGQASVTVSIEIAFFSTTVSLSIEKRIAGSAGDPSFVDAMDPADWQDYCLAFA